MLNYTNTTLQPRQTTIQGNIWSLGVTLWEICEWAKQPYDWLTDDEVITQVLGEPNIRLPKPKLDMFYTDHLYRLMQLCWSSSDQRPDINHVYDMLIHLLQLSNNNTPSKGKDFSLEDFESRWSSLKPNTIVKTDNQLNELTVPEKITDISSVSSVGESCINEQQKSASLTNLHGSFDNLLTEENQPNTELDSWLQNVASDTGDMSYVQGLSQAINALDSALASEQTSSSSSSYRPSPGPEQWDLPKIEFKLGERVDLNSSFNASSNDHSLMDSILYTRNESGSETEDETWKRRIERGAYSEKVRQKSKSVADLMVLTHIDCSDTDSETPLQSLELRKENNLYKNVRCASRGGMDSSMTYGSEGNLLTVEDTFQEELRKLQEERRDSLLFVPAASSPITSEREERYTDMFAENEREKLREEMCVKNVESELLQKSETEITIPKSIVPKIEQEICVTQDEPMKRDIEERLEEIKVEDAQTNTKIYSKSSLLSQEVQTELEPVVKAKLEDLILEESSTRKKDEVIVMNVHVEPLNLLKEVLNIQKEPDFKSSHTEEILHNTPKQEIKSKNELSNIKIDEDVLKNISTFIAEERKSHIVLSLDVSLPEITNFAKEEKATATDVHIESHEMKSQEMKEAEEIDNLKMEEDITVLPEAEKSIEAMLGLSITTEVETGKEISDLKTLDGTFISEIKKDTSQTSPEFDLLKLGSLSEIVKEVTYEDISEKSDTTEPQINFSDYIFSREIKKSLPQTSPESNLQKYKLEHMTEISDFKNTDHSLVTEAEKNLTEIEPEIQTKETLNNLIFQSKEANEQTEDVIYEENENQTQTEGSESEDTNEEENLEIKDVTLPNRTVDMTQVHLEFEEPHQQLESETNKETILKITKNEEMVTIEQSIQAEEIKEDIAQQTNLKSTESEEKINVAHSVQVVELKEDISQQTDAKQIISAMIQTETNEPKISENTSELPTTIISTDVILPEIINSENLQLGESVKNITSEFLLRESEVSLPIVEVKQNSSSELNFVLPILKIDQYEDDNEVIVEEQILDDREETIREDDNLTKEIQEKEEIQNNIMPTAIEKEPDVKIISEETQDKTKEITNKENIMKQEYISNLIADVSSAISTIEDVQKLKESPVENLDKDSNVEKSEEIHQFKDATVETIQSNENSPRKSKTLTASEEEIARNEDLINIVKEFIIKEKHTLHKQILPTGEEREDTSSQTDEVKTISDVTQTDLNQDKKSKDLIEHSKDNEKEIITILPSQNVEDTPESSLQNIKEDLFIETGSQSGNVDLNKTSTFDVQYIEKDNTFIVNRIEPSYLQIDRFEETTLDLPQVTDLDDDIDLPEPSTLHLESEKNNSDTKINETLNIELLEKIGEIQSEPKENPEVSIEIQDKYTDSTLSKIESFLENERLHSNPQENIGITSEVLDFNTTNVKPQVYNVFNVTVDHKTPDLTSFPEPIDDDLIKKLCDKKNGLKETKKLNGFTEDHEIPKLADIILDKLKNEPEESNEKLFTSTPFIKRTKPKKDEVFSYIADGEDSQSSVILGPCEDYTLELYSGLKTTFGKFCDLNDERPEEEILQFSSNFMPFEYDIIDNQMESGDGPHIDYSLETWDKFLGKTLEDNEKTYDTSPRLESLKLDENFGEKIGDATYVTEKNGDLNKPEKNLDATFIKPNTTFDVSTESPTDTSNITFDVPKTSETFTVPDSTYEIQNTTYDIPNKTFDKEPQNNLQKSEVITNSWEPGEGWFLHPQTPPEDLTGQMDIQEDIDNSYVGFTLDEECVNALRNELAAKLPHAQGMVNEEQELEELDNEERNEVS